MTHFWGFGVKFRVRISQNILHHINSAKILSKFCLHKFSPKLNPIWEKRVLNFKFNAFCPVNLNQHCKTKKMKVGPRIKLPLSKMHLADRRRLKIKQQLHKSEISHNYLSLIEAKWRKKMSKLGCTHFEPKTLLIKLVVKTLFSKFCIST